MAYTGFSPTTKSDGISHIDVDRTKAAGGGFTQRDVATSLLVSLSGSFQTTPTFFLNWQNGVNYNLATQTPNTGCNPCRTCRPCR